MKKLLTLFALIPTLMFGQTPTIQQVTNAGNTSTKVIKYNANHGLQFDARTLVDKGYVDSVKTTVPSATLTPTYVGFGSASNLLSGSNNFTWNNSTKVLDILTGKYHGKQMILDDASGGFSYLGLNNIGAPMASPSSGVFLFGDAAGNFNVMTLGGKTAIFDMTGLTGSRTCTLQNGSGTLAFLSDIPSSLPTSSALSTVLTNGSDGASIPITNLGDITNSNANFETVTTQLPAYWQAHSSDLNNIKSSVDITADCQDTVNPSLLLQSYHKQLTNAATKFVEVNILQNAFTIACAPLNQLFPGMQYSASTSTIVRANQTSTTILDRAANDLRYASISTTTATPTGSAGGDLTGTYPNPTIKSSVSLTTPALGAATATSINKVILTAPSTSCTITVANGKALSANNTLTLAGTDATTMTFPSTSATIARTDAANTFTGVQTMTSPIFNTDMTTPTAKLSGTSNQLIFQSAGTTGTISWAPSSSNKTITLPNGTTDFTSTGGTSQFLKQASAGAAITVAQPATTDLSDVVATTTFTPTFGTGFSGAGINLCASTTIGSRVFLDIALFNYTAATQATVTITNIPVGCNATFAGLSFLCGKVKNNGAFPTVVGRADIIGTTLTIYVDASTATNWGGTLNNSFEIHMSYPK